MRLNEHIARIFNENILTLSGKEIDEIIEKIHACSEDTLEEFVILTKLLVYSDKHRLYYFHKQHDLYDHESRIYAIRWLFFLVMLVMLFGYVLFTYDVSSWMKWLTVLMGGFMYMAGRAVYDHMYNWLRPHYKKRHEQWCLMVQKLYHRKEVLLEAIDNI